MTVVSRGARIGFVYDRGNYGPGVVYFIYGERGVLRNKLYKHLYVSDNNIYSSLDNLQQSYKDNTFAYKIGMSNRDPGIRISESGRQWMYDKNLRLVHMISVDNMRIAERMFHLRYKDRVVRQYNGHNQTEWFSIDDKIAGIKRCASINVMPALRHVLGSNRFRDVWKELKTNQKDNIILQLWTHAEIRGYWQ